MTNTEQLNRQDLIDLGAVPGERVAITLVRGVAKTGTVLDVSDRGVLLSGVFPVAGRCRPMTRCSIPVAGIADIAAA